jgi:hypothetical protein
MALEQRRGEPLSLPHTLRHQAHLLRHVLIAGGTRGDFERVDERDPATE